jgi:hypothetical protein
MRGDFSIWRDERRQNFNGVLHQQGRVLLDADWNAQTEITNDWEDTAGRDIIGAGVAGVPADAPESFKVKAAVITGANATLTVAPGRVWADGLLAYLDASADVSRIATYLDLPLETPPAGPAVNTRDAVVLEVWREEINGFQLPELLIEPALGGPDTTERVHTETAFRLFRLTDARDTCESIIDKLKDDFSTKGRLTVTLDAPPPPTGDCPLIQSSGYTGFEHNLYRIEIAAVATGIAPMFKWSQFGGGLVGRGELKNATRTITLNANQQAIVNSGLSQFYMEIVSYDSSLGHWKVTYGANVTLGSNSTLTLPNPSTAGSAGVFFGGPPADGNVFFRLWNAIALISDFDGLAPLPLQDGILLKFDSAVPGNYIPGDYWTFTVRAGEIANTPPLINNQPPAGIHYHRVPLGIITWTIAGAEIEDCRRIFQPLTRLATCCTYRVGDGMHSHGDFRSIQAAVNALPADGGEICVLPGVYEENVLIEKRRNITIKGCGPRTRVVSPPPVGGPTAAPVFRVIESQNIQILSLAAEADESGVGILLVGRAKEAISKAGTDAPLLNITLENLLVRAATRSAIEAKIGYNVTIRRCRIEMEDVATGWPGVFFIGEDSLIEENVIVVADEERRVRGLDWDSPLDPNSAVPARFGRGGLQLGGGCERIRVINNVIARGIETGIILGSLETTTIRTGRPLEVQPPRKFDRCKPCRPGSHWIPPRDSDNPETRSNSEGDLYEILIERNRIFNMGLNGIGAVGFFEIQEVRDFVTVHGLVIDGNVIRRCLGRELEVDPKMLGQGGFGGIALGHVEYLAIRDNCIEDNGPNQLEPVCGIFILYGEGLEISRNWILNNGAKGERAGDDNPALLAKLGARGGINIVKCTAPVVAISLNPAFSKQLGVSSLSTQNGMPAAKVHDNIVSVPLGQALKLSALGPVSVIGNQFTSRGMVLNTDSPSFWASTVMIVNLGRSRDLLVELVSYQGVRTNKSHQLATSPAYGSPVGIPRGYLRSGNVLFSNNQCSLDLLEAGLSLALSSILIFSLDDVAFNNNQCDCNLLDDFVITHALLFGITVRANDNRFREGLFNAVLSAITIGLLNITTDNESTHCLVVEGFRKLRRHNLVLLSALFERDPCRGFEGDDDDDCGFSKTPGGTYWVDPARKTATVNTTTLNTK